MPTGIATSWAASSCWVHAPVAITTMSASTRPASVSTPTTRSPARASAVTVTPSRTSAPSARAPAASAAHDGRCVDLGVVGAEAGAEHVGADRADLAADLGAVDQLHVQAVVAAAGDELLEHPPLLGGGEVDEPALGPELERHGQVADAARRRAGARRSRPRAPSRGCGSAATRSPGCDRRRRSRPPPARAGSPTGPRGRRSRPWPCRRGRRRRRRCGRSLVDPPVVTDRPRLARVGNTSDRFAASRRTIDRDMDLASLGHRDASSAEPIGARAVRRAVMTSACSALWLPCCW